MKALGMTMTVAATFSSHKQLLFIIHYHYPTLYIVLQLWERFCAWKWPTGEERHIRSDGCHGDGHQNSQSSYKIFCRTLCAWFFLSTSSKGDKEIIYPKSQNLEVPKSGYKLAHGFFGVEKGLVKFIAELRPH